MRKTVPALLTSALLVLAPLAAAAEAAAPAADPSARTLEGVVRLLAKDTVEGQSSDHVLRGRSHDHYHRLLQVGDRTYVLKGKGEQAPANKRVRVVGQVEGATVDAASVQDLGADVAAAPNPTGTTRVLVMLAHWRTPDSVTQAGAAAQMFSDSSAWFRDASYTQLGQAGDVTPWMQITGPTGGKCFEDHMNVMNQAKSAATARGYNVANYDNYVLYFPNNSWQTGSDCNGAAGWAYVGAQNTWLNGYMDRRVTVHEQGHNYGLWHAHSHLCSSGGLSGTCSWSDYGDDFDAMGASGLVGHFNAAHKDQLGWMTGRKVDLTAGGSATLAPLARDAAATSGAVVRVSSTRAYWLEHRQAVDHDASLPAYATDGVQVRVVDPAVGGSDDTGSNLLDVRPSDGVSVTSATLRPGQTWTSPERFSFRVDGLSAAGAAVTVTPALDTTAPTVTARTPGVNATNASRTGNVTATFSEPVNGVSATTFTLKHTASGAAVSGTVTRNGTTNQWILDPGVTLAADTRYTATLTGGSGAVRDLAGNPLTTTSWTFLTGPAPTVSTRTPGVNGSNASRTGNITATFSEAVNAVSATTFTLKHTASGAAVSGTVTRNGTTNQWILDPGVTLAADTRYTATLSGGPTRIRDLAGNPLASTSWTFLTGPAPTVSSRTPGVNATNASRTGNITATFSETVNGVSASTFTLKNTATGAAVTGTVTRNGTTSQWILDPGVTLANDTRYTATLSGGPTRIRDLAGNPLATTSWTFLTGPAPTVSSRTPASGATGVSRVANVTATFSEAVNGVSATTFTLRNTATAAAVSSVVSRNGTTNQWILNPGVTLAAGTSYTATLTGGTGAIRDAAGNPLATSRWSFTTRS